MIDAKTTDNELVKFFQSLSKERQANIRSMISCVTSLTTEEFVKNERFSKGQVCPFCGHTHIVRNGHRKDGTQRYICKECHKSFVITANSIVSYTHKDLSVWQKYILCMMNGETIRRSANICHIHKNTAFLWRHKILDALRNMTDKIKLDGIVEADETFFSISYKGNHNKSKSFHMPRESRHRGKDTHVRGLSHEKVCVPCAVNRNGMALAQITNTGRVSTKNLHSFYDGRISKDTTVVTDKMSAYIDFAADNKLNWIQIKGGKSKRGIYNIQHINNYHSQLKKFMRIFNGVSTKYLNNYLIWHNFVNYAKETFDEKNNIFLTFVLTTSKTERCVDVSNRPAVPLLA